MSEEKTTIDLTFLAKQSERIFAEMSGMRSEMSEIRGEMSGIRSEMSEIRGEMSEMRSDMSEIRGEMSEMRSDIAELKAGQKKHGDMLEKQGEILVKVIEAVTALAGTQEKQSIVIGKIHEGQHIIERDLSVIKMRVERIERHTGLVEA